MDDQAHEDRIILTHPRASLALLRRITAEQAIDVPDMDAVAVHSNDNNEA